MYSQLSNSNGQRWPNVSCFLLYNLVPLLTYEDVRSQVSDRPSTTKSTGLQKQVRVEPASISPKMPSISEVKEETLRKQEIPHSSRPISGKSAGVNIQKEREVDELIRNNPNPFISKLQLKNESEGGDRDMQWEAARSPSKMSALRNSALSGLSKNQDETKS